MEISMRIRCSLFLLLAALLIGSSQHQAQAQLTINTTTATDWKIANGSLSMDWDSTTGNVWSMYLTGYSTNLVDTGHLGGDGKPDGLYMDNDGTDMSAGIGNTGVTPTASYHLNSGHYLDWWITWAANSTNPFTVTEHFILQPNDPTLYSYYVVNHSSTAATGNFGQIQYVYRINTSEFVNTYSVNSGLNNLGATEIVLPSQADMNTTDVGRQCQNACVDLHGFSLPSGFGREFYTKYDYSSAEYLHQAHGLYGATFGAWTILPSEESLVGGPTKQDLIFTGNILMGEMLSNHLDNGLGYVPPQGVNTTRIFGPVGFHFNALNSTLTTPAALYQDAVNAIPSALTLFTSDSILTGAGYVPSTGRGTVAPTITGGGSSTANTAWVVLSDQNKNMQYSTLGNEYWASNNSSGTASISNVVPGTYRLSAYVLGQWGQLRQDGVTVTSNSTTSPSLTFTPENFSTASPIWTIGTPDRSAHEFLHGKNSSGNDDREFSGNWNYWSDFAANSGAVNYYATAVGSTPATNTLNDWNYVQWGTFDPGLYGGYYNSSDDTTDGYTYIIPTYVKSLSGATGTNGVTTKVPAWTVHFATTAAQLEQGSYVDLSVGLASVEANLTVSLNGHPITWNYINASDAMARSGMYGYYQWAAFEWPTSDLLAAGGDNILTFSVNNANGVMYDALRMEISNAGANPSTTGWHDYEYVTPNTYVAANDSVSSNN
jgi:Polysaccharide lyase family 4, domain III/Polysaccharide lyase family 4, domain II